MKKVIISAALLFTACSFTMAQDSGFKPAAGANNLELNFVPLNGKPIQLTYIRYRRFLSETTAFRLGVGISYSSTKADSVLKSNVTPGSTVESTYKMNKMGWNLKPGIEKHMAGTDRLSPYIGAELDLAGQSSKELTPVGLSPTDEVMTTTDKNKNKGGFFRLGLGLVAGFDCYIVKNLYLGTELGFGFQMVKYSDYKQTSVPAPATAKDPVSQGSETNIGPNFNSSIRLGYNF